MSKRNGTVAVVTAALLLTTGCSSPGGSASGDAGAPLVIGASVSLTGDFSDSGKAVQRGYQLWADTVNAAGGILGRAVQLKIVDDASSPTQVVTNYQNLINKDRVDLTFGPFSTLLTIPASQVAKRYGYAFLAPAGGGPKMFEQNLDNYFFVQPAPTVQSGDVFVNYVLSLPADRRPKTAAYAELDDPFAAPLAENVRQKLEAAGVRTVYKQVYPSETMDLSPMMGAIAALRPDAIIAGTQNEDAYSQVKSLVQLKFSPSVLFQSNGANSPMEFPDKVGAGNTEGILSPADWFPGSKAPGSADFTAAYIKKYGGTAQSIDDSSAEAYAVGQVISAVAARTNKIDNKTIISSLHAGSWPTLLGTLSWSANGAPSGEFNLVQWQKGKLLPVFPASVAQASPEAPKPAWGG
ncbi:amino acid ABC transporter substrate-binding protein [Kutzneria buriramensis]|uniref:Branched-chain amino acid transport system substrate-binding protein n=1 Tax=Kutzneria buriramensis TaxID=1045776 RepID=A0A3E0HI00_9PSEU|nr:amino acid ABC transporter substrate-binding protein [Kutzneria buriramensis]REH46119.1 branched-chain amino acid transport system substrate-binding protein [Kutzneria buriramensis]